MGAKSVTLYDRLLNDRSFIKSFEGTVIIGITGTNGAGKSTFVEELESRGYMIIKVSDMLRRVARASIGSIQRGGSQSPLGRIGNAIREQYPGGLVDIALIEWWSLAAHLSDDIKPHGFAIDNIRSLSEAQRLKEIGGTMVAIDADRKIRYERVLERRREDDEDLSFEEFCRREDADLGVGETNPKDFSMQAVLGTADVTLYNEGTPAEFTQSIGEMLETLDRW